MVVAVIGVIALVASIGSGFTQGIAVGLGLIALGVALEVMPGRHR
jgi:hypothetical protein